jgi:hypothetical protein
MMTEHYITLCNTTIHNIPFLSFFPLPLYMHSELRLAEAKLQSTEKELDSLSVERLKHGASVYR